MKEIEFDWLDIRETTIGVRTSSLTNKLVSFFVGVGSALQTMQFCNLFASDCVRTVEVIFRVSRNPLN